MIFWRFFFLSIFLLVTVYPDTHNTINSLWMLSSFFKVKDNLCYRIISSACLDSEAKKDSFLLNSNQKSQCPVLSLKNKTKKQFL